MDINSNENKKTKESLSGRISGTFISLLRRVLIVVCLESVLIGGVFAIMYTLNDNSSSARDYTEKIDRDMQSKVSMLESIAAGISSGTLNDNAAILSYVDSMVAMDEQVSAVYSCYDENITIMSGGW